MMFTNQSSRLSNPVKVKTWGLLLAVLIGVLPLIFSNYLTNALQVMVVALPQ